MARPRSADALPAKKIGLLHVARKQLGLDEDTYRDILREWGGVESSADLDEGGFKAVMFRLEKLGFQSTGGKRNFGDRHHSMASGAQVSLIRKLWSEYHPDDADERHLNAWLSKFHHVSALRFVSADKAGSVLTALKRMVARKQDRR